MAVVTGALEHGLDFIKCGEQLEQLSDCRPLASEERECFSEIWNV
jgi:hypothetical protein